MVWLSFFFRWCVVRCQYLFGKRVTCVAACVPVLRRRRGKRGVHMPCAFKGTRALKPIVCLGVVHAAPHSFIGHSHHHHYHCMWGCTYGLYWHCSFALLPQESEFFGDYIMKCALGLISSGVTRVVVSRRENHSLLGSARCVSHIGGSKCILRLGSADAFSELFSSWKLDICVWLCEKYVKMFVLYQRSGSVGVVSNGVVPNLSSINGGVAGINPAAAASVLNVQQKTTTAMATGVWPHCRPLGYTLHKYSFSTHTTRTIITNNKQK